jgi:hypothetical protein
MERRKSCEHDRFSRPPDCHIAPRKSSRPLRHKNRLFTPLFVFPSQHERSSRATVGPPFMSSLSRVGSFVSVILLAGYGRIGVRQANIASHLPATCSRHNAPCIAFGIGNCIGCIWLKAMPRPKLKSGRSPLNVYEATMRSAHRDPFLARPALYPGHPVIYQMEDEP